MGASLARSLTSARWMSASLPLALFGVLANLSAEAVADPSRRPSNCLARLLEGGRPPAPRPSARAVPTRFTPPVMPHSWRNGCTSM